MEMQKRVRYITEKNLFGNQISLFVDHERGEYSMRAFNPNGFERQKVKKAGIKKIVNHLQSRGYVEINRIAS